MKTQKTVYRIIRFQGDEDLVDNQVANSVMEGDYNLPIDGKLRITIRDRPDDPCERNFFNDVEPIVGYPTRKPVIPRKDKD